MKVVVTGTRGIPNILGGVETHCEELFPRIVNLGKEVVVLRRSCYITEQNKIGIYKGVHIKDIYCPKTKSLEAVVHTFLSILYAKKIKADILHIHAIGPGLLTPFARLLGLKVVVTHHGPDYDRQKWGKLAKWMLMLGEKMATLYSNEIVVISSVIANSLEKFNRKTKCRLIYNGVNTPIKSTSTTYLQTLNIEPKKYVLAMGRFVEEKGFHNLITAFSKLDASEFRLVIAGDADHETPYSKRLKQMAMDHNVVLTGFIKGEKLNELLSHAHLFVLPSYHEGLPIALLEAMSYNLDVLVSDIPANKEVGLHQNNYFNVGNEKQLAEKLNIKLNQTTDVQYNIDKYNWDKIAIKTNDLYDGLLKKS